MGTLETGWTSRPRMAACLRITVMACVLMPALIARAQPDGGGSRGECVPMDADCDSMIGIADAGAFISVLLGDSACSACAGDLNEDGVANGDDVQLFVDGLLTMETLGACCDAGGGCVDTASEACAGSWLGAGTTCAMDLCTTGTLTVYRPRHGSGYFPFDRTAVSAVDKLDASRGPGIRLNLPGDADASGEDDLIELVVSVNPPGAAVALRRGDPALRVWTTPNKVSETEVPFVGDVTDALPIGGGQTTLTLWIEWASASHGIADLELETLDGAITFDVVTLHTFQSIVIALGGESQPTSVPVDPNHGTFVVGRALYAAGYDVFMYDEDNVSSDGSGAVFNEVVDAVGQRGVDRVAIFGYSHGGGSTYDLADRLDAQRAGIGNFEIEFTSYVDGVGNNSDVDTAMETRRPPSTGLHANHYQHGTLFEDFFLDGGPVANSIPAPTGLDVETTPWGSGCTHFEVDDFVQVRSFIELNLMGALMP